MRLPSEVSEYITVGGTVGSSSRLTRPLASSSRKVWLSIFFEMPGRLRSRTPERAEPACLACSVCRIMLVHLVANSSRTRRGAQSSSHSSSFDPGFMLVTFLCLLGRGKLRLYRLLIRFLGIPHEQGTRGRRQRHHRQRARRY